MYKKIIDKLKDKKIAILGFGKEGQSTYRFIRRYLHDKHLTILDLNEMKNNPLLEGDHHIDLVCGNSYLDNLSIYDVIIKAPGVSLKAIKDDSILEKVTSQLELLLEVNRENVIGITGTKGKSTTASLLYEVLKDQDVDVFLLGNIGIPVLDKIEEYHENSTLVIEMSSHQLEFLHVSPHIGMILNLYQDHLDHAGNLEHYHDIKMNMFRYQEKNDIALYASDNEALNQKVNEEAFKGNFYDIRFCGSEEKNHSTRLIDKKVYVDGNFVYEDQPRLLIGDHNLKNIMFVLTICKIKNLDLEKAANTIKNFKGLKYRMECIGTFHDIIYYNDTIATIPEATMNSIEALKEVDTLIFGGMDRKIDYKKFISYLKECKVKHFICMPTTGIMIGEQLKSNENKEIFFVDTLKDAYEMSLKVTEKGKICLLSPAAASYEYFKNFEEKGKAFEEMVKGK